LLLPTLVFGQASLPDHESLEYTAYYKGILSSWIKLAIARVRLHTDVVETLTDHQAVYVSVLELSTETYRKAELLYPFRFRYATRFSPALLRTQLVYVRQRARRGEEALLWFRWRGRRVERFKWREGGDFDSEQGGVPDELAIASRELARALRRRYPGLVMDPERLRFAGYGERALVDRALDRLALLHYVRFQDLRPGHTMTMPVSDGKALAGYHVTVDRRQWLERGEEKLETFKLSLDPFYSKPQARPHPRVYVWVSTDPRRLPVRFRVGQAHGTFELVLTGQPHLPFARQ
jgi:hypothetical protein